MYEQKAAKIKLLILDVDGVLTDGMIWIDDHGREQKGFDIKDGFGLKLLMNTGINVAIITGRQSAVVAKRADELGIRDVYQGIADKRIPYNHLLKENGLHKDQVCYVGDDLPDLPLLGEVGFAVTVADAVREVRDRVDFVTKNRGGSGAVREVCELLLKSQGKWNGLVLSYDTGK